MAASCSSANVPGALVDADLFQQRLLVVQHAHRHAIGNAGQTPVPDRHLAKRRNEIVPAEIGVLACRTREQLLVIVQMRVEPADLLRRPLDDVNAAGAGIQLGLQLCIQRVDRQEREIDLDAGRLLERRRHFLDQAPVPRPVVADEHQFFWSVLRQGKAWQHDGRGGCLQQVSAFDHRPIPARRRLRCQSPARSSSACFGVFCPNSACDSADRIWISSVSHTG